MLPPPLDVNLPGGQKTKKARDPSWAGRFNGLQYNEMMTKNRGYGLNPPAGARITMGLGPGMAKGLPE